MEFKINHAGTDIIFCVDDIKDRYLQKSALKALKKFFCGFSHRRDTPGVLLSYRLTDHIDDFFKTDRPVIMSESAKINDYQMFISGHGNQFGYEFTDGRLTTLYYGLIPPSRIENNKSRAVSRSFESNVEAQISAMYSRGFLHGLQLISLSLGMSFMHACSFAIEDKGYIVAATPGAGKSSLLLAMSFDKALETNFISDDFSCIDKEGHIHYIGRPMAIKSHQIQYFPELKDKLNDMSLMQQLQWFILKQRGLKRMGTPQQIFGNRVTTDIPVHKAFYLTNHNCESFSHEAMSPETFANLNANMLFSELFLGIETMNHALILPGNNLMPSVDRFISETRRILTDIFQSIPCELVKVPFRSDPRKLLRYLKSEALI